VKWTPQSGQNRLRSMIEARPDWVLSRQRAWGVPLTCFVKKGAARRSRFPAARPGGQRAHPRGVRGRGRGCLVQARRQGAVPRQRLRPEEYEQVFDILDVWFDSGSTHAFVLRDRPDGTEDGIADVYMEGTDQHRGWFHSSLLQACGTIGRAPYRNVVTHGFTLDEKGMKMSKSLGNTVAPQEVVNQYGADILRLWVAQADYTADQRIGPEILKGRGRQLPPAAQHDALHAGLAGGFHRGRPRRARPTCRSWSAGCCTGWPSWTPRCARATRLRLPGRVPGGVQFATTDLSAFYFDIRKDALYCDGDTQRRRAARTVLDILFHRLTTWLAPILVFTMEEVWLERFPGDDSSVHLQDIPETPGRLARRGAGREMGPHPRRAPRGDGGAGGAAARQGDRRLAGGRAGGAGVPTRTSAVLKTVPMDDICITSGLTVMEASRRPTPSASTIRASVWCSTRPRARNASAAGRSCPMSAASRRLRTL
jgi:isoleucyl-tRNA synthetase